MKLVILAGDIIDAKIVLQELLKAGRDIRGVIYEGSRTGLKSKARLLSMVLSRRLKGLSFKSIGSRHKGLIVERVGDINSERTLELLKKIQAELIVVVGTRKLDKEIFNTASIGAINLHSGILPFYRGSDSEFWALYNNHSDMVGVTIHFIEEGLDAGDIIVEERLPVNPRDTVGSLRMKNILLGAKKINQAISLIESGVYPKIKQDASCARLYPSASVKERQKLSARRRQWSRRGLSVVKSFGNGLIRAEEEVAAKPLIEFMAGQKIDWPAIFCLRIDADEFDKSAFDNYLSLFKKYPSAVTIFFNIYSFRDAADKIKESRDVGLDIQSHGFYHHTYNDYKSNRRNIAKAKGSLEKLGINTVGFTAPMGRYNANLMRALEDEGYEYSSDFSYDYLGLPSYPCIGRRFSRILQIPIFPVAPELFFRQEKYSFSQVADYYKAVIDQMCDCGLPAIIYAHSSIFADNPGLLNDIADYAIVRKGLAPANMTVLNHWWRGRVAFGALFPVERKILKVPKDEFLGRKANLRFKKKIKVKVSRMFDFERITPESELCCPQPQRGIKLLLRRIS